MNEQADQRNSKSKEYPKVTAIICTLNEEESLPNVLTRIPEWVDEIIIVDGHSNDRTVEIAKELCPRVKVLYQPGRGKGDALKHGAKNAAGDIIVTLDADDATDPAEMTKFIEPLIRGYDFAKGSRFIGGFPLNKSKRRIFGNLAIAGLFDLLFISKYTDLCSGYNAYWKNKMERVDLSSTDGFENEPLFNIRVRKAGLKVIEVGHVDRGRQKGEVKEASWRQGFKAVKGILRERFNGG